MALASVARAADVVLWACHGPAGQPLGLGPLAASNSGDGVTRTYGSGCSSQIAAPTDGGLEATFARADPAGRSQAGWRATVPAATTLTSFALDRITSGFGGLPQAGDPLVYDASTSAAVLESSSLADTSDRPLAGRASFPAVTGTDAGFAVACGLGAGARCAAPTTGSIDVEVAAMALGVDDGDAPLGAVGGIENPVTGPLPLYITASDSGVGLESATATLAGEAPVTVALGGPSCAALSTSSTEVDLPLGADCPTSVSDVPITLGTAAVADGSHQLTVTLSDAAGNVTTLASQTVLVLNHVVVPGSSALVSIGNGGSGPTTAGTGGAGGGGVGRSAPVCVSPKLSALLASRPLRITGHNVAVLWAGTRYLFTGSLTCVVKRRRVGAPIGTVIAIYSLRGQLLARERTGATTYGRRGRFRVLLHPRSSRTVIFQYGGGSSTRRVRIRVLVTPRRSGRR